MTATTSRPDGARREPLRVALTGGIGAGKSTVSALLSEHGAVVIDHDLLARQVVEPGTPGLAQVVAEFGREVQGDDGALDRAALGQIVFADPSARRRLEQITHPLIVQAADDAEARARAAGAHVIVHDIPLLVETGQGGTFDQILVVSAPVAVRVARLRQRGLSEHEAHTRMDAQIDDDARRRAADVVFDNSGTVEDLRAAVGRWWAQTVRGARPGQAG